MEHYRIGKGHRPSFACSVLLLMFVWPCISSAPYNFQGHVSDDCNWNGSGLDAQTWNDVVPIYLRCQAGIINWQYPRGALRIILHLGHSNKNFQACIKVTKESDGANLYLEGHQELQVLYQPNNVSDVENPRLCFQSYDGQVALFLDAQIAKIMKKDTFNFMYDLQSVKEKSFSECRPCTERELIYYFCTSDFVARGSISSIYQNEHLKRTELVVKSYDVFRDSEPKVFTSSREKSMKFTGVVHRPIECGTKVGFGDFLFMGRWRLGEPILRCVPRWTEWKKVRRKASLSESSDCLLQ